MNSELTGARCGSIARDSRLISYTLDEELSTISFEEEFGSLG